MFKGSVDRSLGVSLLSARNSFKRLTVFAERLPAAHFTVGSPINDISEPVAIDASRTDDNLREV